MRARRQRRGESGYALLFVYLMAAVVAIMLYSELPRVAFEAQRAKEQLLIDRGEQYQRAINLYVRKNNRFPPDFDALDKTAGQRFLRHRYKDPMTGKDDWRIVHVGPGGVFTDSLLYTKKKTDQAGGPQNFITELQQIGGSAVDPNAQPGSLAARRRPSDLPGAPGSVPSDPNAIPNGANNGIPNGAPPGIPNGLTGIPNGIPNGVQPGTQAGVQPGLPPGVQFPPGTQPPPGFPQQLQQPGAQPSQAATNLIGQLLTTPRPGGIGGLSGIPSGAGVDQFGNAIQQGMAAAGIGGSAPGPGGTTPPPVQGQTIGGGIAGVASKLEREGIKIYRDKTAYNEWEFVYDLTLDKSRTGLGTGTPGAVPVGGQAAGGAQAGTSTPAFGATPGGQQPVNNAAPQPVYTPPQPQQTFTPPPPTPQFPTGNPDPTYNQGNPNNPGSPLNPGNLTQPGNPGNPANPGNPFGGSTAPTTQFPQPGGIVPSAPIGGGGMVPSPPIGGGAPH